MKVARPNLFVAVFLSIAFLVGSDIVQATIFNEVRITYNEYNDEYPSISGNKIVWQGWDGFDYEIYCYDIQTGGTSEITHNVFDDDLPFIEGNLIVWHYCETYLDVHLYVHDLGSGETTELTQDTIVHPTPYVFVPYDVDDPYVVWKEETIIYLYDSSTGETAQLADTIESGEQWNIPSISQGRVVWTDNVDDSIQKTYLYDAADGETTEIRSSSMGASEVFIRGDRVVWLVPLDMPSEEDAVYVLDLDTGEESLLTDDFDVLDLTLGENGIAFCGAPPPYPPYEENLYFYGFQSGEINLIAERGDLEWYQDTRGTDLVWHQVALTGREIFHYNIETGVTSQVTHDIFTDELPRVDNGVIAWHGYAPDSETYEIYMTVPSSAPAYPEPANTIAASYGRSSLIGSGVYNSLALLLIPVGGIIFLRILRRRK
jgi:beta propeller repeat protein